MKYILNSVAIATEHGFWRAGLCQFISSQTGFHVIHEVNNEANLLAQITRTSKVPHFCILDAEHNESSCAYITQELKRSFHETRVITFLSQRSRQVMLKMVDAGVNCILPKSCSDSDLAFALNHLRCNCQYYPNDVIDLLNGSDAVHGHELSVKELKFLSLCCSELTYKEIADKMKLSLRAIESIRESLFKKLNAVSRTGLIIKAVKNKIISI